MCKNVVFFNRSYRFAVAFSPQIREPSEVKECDVEAAKSKIHKTAEKFRENFFKGQEISRAERKERIKKYGHLNLPDDNGENNSEIQS